MGGGGGRFVEWADHDAHERPLEEGGNLLFVAVLLGGNWG